MYESYLALLHILLLYCLALEKSASLNDGKDISRLYANPCFNFRFVSTLAKSKIPQC